MTFFTQNHAPQIRKFGRNPSISGEGDVVDYGSEANFPAAPGILTIESTDPADDFTNGANAKTVAVLYLDENGKLASGTIQLNGTNPVMVAEKALFCYRFRCITFGENKSNAGQIIAKIGPDIVASAPIGYIQTQIAAMIVPANYSFGFVQDWRIYAIRVSAINGEAGLLIREPGEEGFAVRSILPLSQIVQEEKFDDNEMLKIPALSCVKLRVIQSSVAPALVAGSFNMRFI